MSEWTEEIWYKGSKYRYTRLGNGTFIAVDKWVNGNVNGTWADVHHGQGDDVTEIDDLYNEYGLPAVLEYLDSAGVTFPT